MLPFAPFSPGCSLCGNSPPLLQQNKYFLPFYTICKCYPFTAAFVKILQRPEKYVKKISRHTAENSLQNITNFSGFYCTDYRLIGNQSASFWVFRDSMQEIPKTNFVYFDDGIFIFSWKRASSRRRRRTVFSPASSFAPVGAFFTAFRKLIKGARPHGLRALYSDSFCLHFVLSLPDGYSEITISATLFSFFTVSPIPSLAKVLLDTVTVPS